MVFDTAAGGELARRKSFSPRDLAFLCDSRTLAIPMTGSTPREPITLWCVPDS